tara:strand:- start:239 stop:1552 length:1314 start_codon:yes stop_codon:yes gene_type:complete
MGGFVRKIKKVVKKVTKPITKIVKKTVKRVKKIGKSVMKGVAKVSAKLGPVGMIALSIAMPYALGGLSSLVGTAGGTTGLMNSSNLFLKSIGTIGNSIRTGYQAFNTFASTAKQGISNTISKAFSKLAPKGTGNIFSRISQGAKNLYNAGKQKLKSVMPKPFTAKEGTIEVFGMGDPGVSVISSSDAAAAIQKGTLQASELGKQTLTQPGGWFTKTNSSGITSDRLVTETINDAYKARLDGFGQNATRMFNDIKNKAMEMDTYLNDEQIGSFVENNVATKSYTNEIMEYAGDMDYIGSGTGKFQIKTEIPDLAQTGDYTLGTARDRLSGTYNFTGNETFGKQEATKGFFSKNKSKLANITKSLLKPSEEAPVLEAPLSIPQAPLQGTNFNTMYAGTDQAGSSGGNLVAAVYGTAAANNIKNYYKNMNLLNSGESYIT